MPGDTNSTAAPAPALGSSAGSSAAGHDAQAKGGAGRPDRLSLLPLPTLPDKWSFSLGQYGILQNALNEPPLELFARTSVLSASPPLASVPERSGDDQSPASPVHSDAARPAPAPLVEPANPPLVFSASPTVASVESSTNVQPQFAPSVQIRPNAARRTSQTLPQQQYASSAVALRALDKVWTLYLPTHVRECYGTFPTASAALQQQPVLNIHQLGGGRVRAASSASTHPPTMTLGALQGESMADTSEFPMMLENWAVVGMVDISGYSALASQLFKSVPHAGEVLQRVINEVFEPILDVIMDHGGDVVKFAGDAILVCWAMPRSAANVLEASASGWAPGASGAAPEPSPPPIRVDHKLHLLSHALMACHKIARNMRGYTRSIPELEKPVKLDVHISLAADTTYHVHVGNKGTRREYFLSGPATLSASALLDKAKRGELVLSLRSWRDAALERLKASVTVEINEREGFVIIKSLKEDALASCSQSVAPLSSEMSASALKTVREYLSDYAIYRLFGKKSGLTNAPPSAPSTLTAATIAGLSQPQTGSRDAIPAPPAIAEEVTDALLAANEVKSDINELRRIVVMFIKFKPVGDIVSRADAIGFYQMCMSMVVAKLAECEGQLRQFAVDDKAANGCTALCAWGLPPRSHEIEERFALKMALQIKQASMSMNIAVCIGIAAGPSFTGYVGNRSRRDHTILGDCVNLAARYLSVSTSEHTIICDSSVCNDAIRDRFRFTSLGKRKIKGKTTEIECFSLLERLAPQKTGHGGSPLKVADYERMLIRKQLAGELLQRYQHWRTGKKCCLVIEGESGQGKSFLSNYAAARAQEDGAIVWHVQASEYDQSTPLHVFKGLVSNLLNLTLDTDIQSKLQAVPAESGQSGGPGGQAAESGGPADSGSGLPAEAAVAGSAVASPSDATDGSSPSGAEARPEASESSSPASPDDGKDRVLQRSNPAPSDRAARNRPWSIYDTVSQNTLSTLTRSNSGKNPSRPAINRAGPDAPAGADSNGAVPPVEIAAGVQSPQPTEGSPTAAQALDSGRKVTSFVACSAQPAQGAEVLSNKQRVAQLAPKMVQETLKELAENPQCWLIYKALVLLDEDVRLIPLFDRVLTNFNVNDNSYTRTLSEEERTQLVLDILQRAVDRISRVQQLCLVLDDGQWSDQTSWQFSLLLAQKCPRLLLVLVTRPAVEYRCGTCVALYRAIEALENTYRIPTPGLSEQELFTYTSTAAREFGFPAKELLRVSNAIYSQSDGNLSIASRLVSTFVAIARQLPRDMVCESFESTLVGGGPGDGGETNATMRTIILSQFDKLDTDFQELLKIASCMVPGQSFSMREVVEVAVRNKYVHLNLDNEMLQRQTTAWDLFKFLAVDALEAPPAGSAGTAEISPIGTLSPPPAGMSSPPVLSPGSRFGAAAGPRRLRSGTTLSSLGSAAAPGFTEGAVISYLGTAGALSLRAVNNASGMRGSGGVGSVVRKAAKVSAAVVASETAGAAADRGAASGLRFHFRHVAIQTAIYQSLLTERRHELHIQLAAYYVELMKKELATRNPAYEVLGAPGAWYIPSIYYHYSRTNSREERLIYMELTAYFYANCCMYAEARSLLQEMIMMVTHEPSLLQVLIMECPIIPRRHLWTFLNGPLDPEEDATEVPARPLPTGEIKSYMRLRLALWHLSVSVLNVMFHDLDGGKRSAKKTLAILGIPIPRMLLLNVLWQRYRAQRFWSGHSLSTDLAKGWVARIGSTSRAVRMSVIAYIQLAFCTAHQSMAHNRTLCAFSILAANNLSSVSSNTYHRIDSMILADPVYAALRVNHVRLKNLQAVEDLFQNADTAVPLIEDLVRQGRWATLMRYGELQAIHGYYSEARDTIGGSLEIARLTQRPFPLCMSGHATGKLLWLLGEYEESFKMGRLVIELGLDADGSFRYPMIWCPVLPLIISSMELDCMSMVPMRASRLLQRLMEQSTNQVTVLTCLVLVFNMEVNGGDMLQASLRLGRILEQSRRTFAPPSAFIACALIMGRAVHRFMMACLDTNVRLLTPNVLEALRAIVGTLLHNCRSRPLPGVLCMWSTLLEAFDHLWGAIEAVVRVETARLAGAAGDRRTRLLRFGVRETRASTLGAAYAVPPSPEHSARQPSTASSGSSRNSSSAASPLSPVSRASGASLQQIECPAAARLFETLATCADCQPLPTMRIWLQELVGRHHPDPWRRQEWLMQSFELANQVSARMQAKYLARCFPSFLGAPQP